MLFNTRPFICGNSVNYRISYSVVWYHPVMTQYPFRSFSNISLYAHRPLPILLKNRNFMRVIFGSHDLFSCNATKLSNVFSTGCQRSITRRPCKCSLDHRAMCISALLSFTVPEANLYAKCDILYKKVRQAVIR